MSTLLTGRWAVAPSAAPGHDLLGLQQTPETRLVAAVFLMVHADLAYGWRAVRRGGRPRYHGLDAYWWLHTPAYIAWLAVLPGGLEPATVRAALLRLYWPADQPRPPLPLAHESLPRFRRRCLQEG